MDSISYTVAGSGPTVVLLHGFPMDHTVWKDVVKKLESSCQVYTPDLPGFGTSSILPAGFTIDQVADHLLNWLTKINLKETVLIGHSLGGYIALAMAAKEPLRFKGIGLFHSTAYPDSEEKKESRSKTIEFIERNGALAFTANFIQPLFAQPLHPAVEYVKKVAIKSTEPVVIGYLQAMRDRPGREQTLAEFHKPILFIAGDQDKGIPATSIEAQAKLCQRPHLHILGGVAHMGMYEAPEKAGKLLQSFVFACQ